MSRKNRGGRASDRSERSDRPVNRSFLFVYYGKAKHHHFLTDVLDFYPRTESTIVHNVFTDVFDFTPRAAKVATRLTTLNGGLPQGTHPSTHPAYLAFREIDCELYEYADRHGITYTRYGDDLSFSAPHNFKSKVDDIMEIVEGSDTRYNLHQGDKTYYKPGPVEITGVQVLNNKIVPPDRLEKKLARLNPSSAQWESLKRQLDRIEKL